MKYILTHIANRIGTITINRPEKRNALNQEVVAELTQVVTDFESNDDIKVIILTGQGKAFCAGADLGYLQSLQDFSDKENLEDSLQLRNLFMTIYRCKKVVIAKIQGHAIAGGAGLATVCDFSIASDKAKFGYTEVKIGFIPAIVMPFLLRKIGNETKAKELLLTGKIITAVEAYDLGILTQAVASDDLDTEVSNLCEALVKNCSAQSLSATKQLFTHLGHLSIEEATERAATQNAKARKSEDCIKGINAFLNKENIQW